MRRGEGGIGDGQTGNARQGGREEENPIRWDWSDSPGGEQRMSSCQVNW